MNTPRYETAPLFGVDSTLLDNGRVIAGLQSHLGRQAGAALEMRGGFCVETM